MKTGRFLITVLVLIQPNAWAQDFVRLEKGIFRLDRCPTTPREWQKLRDVTGLFLARYFGEEGYHRFFEDSGLPSYTDDAPTQDLEFQRVQKEVEECREGAVPSEKINRCFRGIENHFLNYVPGDYRPHTMVDREETEKVIPLPDEFRNPEVVKRFSKIQTQELMRERLDQAFEDGLFPDSWREFHAVFSGQYWRAVFYFPPSKETPIARSVILVSGGVPDGNGFFVANIGVTLNPDGSGKKIYFNEYSLKRDHQKRVHVAPEPITCLGCHAHHFNLINKPESVALPDEIPLIEAINKEMSKVPSASEIHGTTPMETWGPPLGPDASKWVEKRTAEFIQKCSEKALIDAEWLGPFEDAERSMEFVRNNMSCTRCHNGGKEDRAKLTPFTNWELFVGESHTWRKMPPRLARQKFSEAEKNRIRTAIAACLKAEYYGENGIYHEYLVEGSCI